MRRIFPYCTINRRHLCVFLIHQEGEKNRERKTKTRLDKNHFMGHFSVVDDVGAALWLGVFDRLVQRKPHRTARYCCRLLYLSYGIYGDADYGGRVFSRALSVGANRNRTAKVAETKCGDFFAPSCRSLCHRISLYRLLFYLSSKSGQLARDICSRNFSRQLFSRATFCTPSKIT